MLSVVPFRVEDDLGLSSGTAGSGIEDVRGSRKSSVGRERMVCLLWVSREALVRPRNTVEVIWYTSK